MIELLVTLAILAVLATMAFPTAMVVERRHKEQELRLALQQIRHALDAYKQAVDSGKIRRATTSGYPPDLPTLVHGAVRTADGSRMYFLRRLPRDPFAGADVHPEQSWGVRSYASSAEQPKQGDDIYDVYSQSPLTALDGSTYRSW